MSKEAIKRAVDTLAGLDDDFAEAKNGWGFNSYDTDFGHSLASKPIGSWTPKMTRAAWKMLKKYRRQLENYDIYYDEIEEPAEPVESGWPF